ncbi:MAG: HPr family phosphocarrier protein, partial [Alicyclobacillus sp.]|nr:HPr family phosphocarrier protein [Alicyclobacillus sp.]
MVEKKAVVKLRTGLLARPAALFVQEANRFSSEIFLEKDGKSVNAKSIMG